MVDEIMEPLDFEDEEAQDPEPLPKGTEVEVEIRSGGVNTDYGFAQIFLRILDDAWENHFISPLTLNKILAEDEEWKRRSAKRGARHFCEGFGIDAKTFNAVIADAFEAASNGEDPRDTFEPFQGMAARIISKLDKNDRPVVGRFLVNKLAKK